MISLSRAAPEGGRGPLACFATPHVLSIAWVDEQTFASDLLGSNDAAGNVRRPAQAAERRCGTTPWGPAFIGPAAGAAFPSVRASGATAPPARTQRELDALRPRNVAGGWRKGCN
jgi:hypothetical protein